MRSHLALSCLLFIASCTPVVVWETAETEADVEAINSLRDEFIAFDNASDAAGLASLYTNDAVLMPPNEAAVTGNQAIESWFLYRMQRHKQHLSQDSGTTGFSDSRQVRKFSG